MVWPSGSALAEPGRKTNPSKTNTLKMGFGRLPIGINSAGKQVLEYKPCHLCPSCLKC